ncbi:MAG: class I SAM-dependent methyltransferase [Acidobacteriota bacterium]
MARSPRETAAQLRRPHGPEADAAATRMNRVNAATNHRAIDALGISARDRVLEIGPGNGHFVESLIDRAPGVSYVGLDWSEEMVTAARRGNARLVESGVAEFRVGTSSRIPVGEGTIDKALAIHTIYFWDDPRSHLAELRRVLKPDGILCLGFGDRRFMERLPFTAHGFRLYDRDTAVEQLEAVGFRIERSVEHLERGESNTGAIVEKLVHLLVCTPDPSVGDPP